MIKQPPMDIGTYVHCGRHRWIGVIDNYTPWGDSDEQYRVVPLDAQGHAFTDWYSPGDLRPLTLLELIALAATGHDV